MTRQGVLIANRGEVGVRLVRAAHAAGLRAVVVFGEDDANSMHRRVADGSVPLAGRGPSAYLDAKAMVEAATRSGCDFLHPGWGFLSEQAELAALCAAAGITFVGPSSEVLAVLGDKASARRLAQANGVSVVPGSDGPATPESAMELMRCLESGRAVMLKAVAGGGGRGIRIVDREDRLQAAFRESQAEARAAFGDDRVLVEQYIPNSRHVEVQVLGDGSGSVAVLGDRDCSVQRNHQKLIEVAPAPALRDSTRDELWRAAGILAEAVHYSSLGTFEFLVDADDESWWFMEANPRLQVEHTITEELLRVDLVAAQLDVARGRTLAELAIDIRLARGPGAVIQLRLNAERVTPHGVLPSAGMLTELVMPTGVGIRVDTGMAAGDEVSPRFDSLVAKMIAVEPAHGLAGAVRRAREALDQVRVEGVDTNIRLLAAILDDPRLAQGRFLTSSVPVGFASGHDSSPGPGEPASTAGEAIRLVAQTAGVVVQIDVAVGQQVKRGTDLVRVEAMKMQHVTTAPDDGIVTTVPVSVGDECRPGTLLVGLDPVVSSDPAPHESPDGAVDLGTALDSELATLAAHHQRPADSSRPAMVAVRHAAGKRTSREHLDRLFDPETFL